MDDLPTGADRVEGVAFDAAAIERNLLGVVSADALRGARDPDDDFRILKLPLGRVGGRQADFSTSVDNEYLCLRLLVAYGLPTARALEVMKASSLTCTCAALVCLLFSWAAAPRPGRRQRRARRDPAWL